MLEIPEAPWRCCTDPVGVFLRRKTEAEVQYLYDENFKQAHSTEKVIVFMKTAHTLTHTRDKNQNPITCLQVLPGYQKPAQGMAVSELSACLLSRENPPPGLQRAQLLQTWTWHCQPTEERAHAAERGPAPSRAGAACRALTPSTARLSAAPPSARNETCCALSPDPARQGTCRPKRPQSCVLGLGAALPARLLPWAVPTPALPGPGKGSASPRRPQRSLPVPGDGTKSRTVGAGTPEPTTHW